MLLHKTVHASKIKKAISVLAVQLLRYPAEHFFWKSFPSLTIWDWNLIILQQNFLDSIKGMIRDQVQLTVKIKLIHETICLPNSP